METQSKDGVFALHEVRDRPRSLDSDDAALSRLGKKPVLKLTSATSIGWLTLAGWQASVGSGAYLTGTLVQGLLVLTQPSYVPHNWHGTLLYWAVMMFCITINIAAGWLLPKFEGGLLILHIVGFFAVLIPLLTLGPKGDTKEVFTTFYNLGGWQTQEIQNAALVVPRSIMTGIMINGSLGFGMVLTVLYRAGDIDAALAENPAYPFMAIFKHATNSTAAAAVMASLIFCLATSATVGLLASSSRVFWAFSRDKGLPGERTAIPVYSVATTTIIACVLALVNIGSSTAFNGIISVSIAGLFSSYLLVAALLLYRRCTGGIVPAGSVSATSPTDTLNTKIVWGPWKIPGAMGIANNVFACAYLSFVLFFSFWPSFAEVSPANMNWSILVTGFIAIFSALYYLIWAKKTYHGPIVEVEPRYVHDVRA
ncbi:hypothetical protein SLS60_006594 [Paraconiothyrium brasiliense]|uniref:Amino acid permease n=1 Tax=Paraconiothyrium brasiliense TaxID=300254 RepID=A0ABR3RC32_9PLEO